MLSSHPCRSFLVNYLKNAKSDAARVLYHYFDFRAESRYHRGVAVVRNLLRQLLEQDDHLPESILSLHEKSRQAELELTDKVWIDTFCSMISSSPQVFIMIDGFDECPDRLSLSRFLRSLKHTGAKLYIAGRSPIDVAFDFLGHHNIEMLAPKSDLITYIQSRLEADEDLGSLLAKSLMDEFVATLIGLADGVQVLCPVPVGQANNYWFQVSSRESGLGQSYWLHYCSTNPKRSTRSPERPPLRLSSHLRQNYFQSTRQTRSGVEEPRLGIRKQTPADHEGVASGISHGTG